MRITFELDSSDLRRFHDAFERARRLAGSADEPDIIDAAKQAGYVTLIRLVLRVLETSIHLLGFTAPDRM